MTTCASPIAKDVRMTACTASLSSEDIRRAFGIGDELFLPKMQRSTSSRLSDAFSSTGSFHRDLDDGELLIWAALERLPTVERSRKGILLSDNAAKNGCAADTQAEVDVSKLDVQDRRRILSRLIPTAEEDNERLLLRLRDRINRVRIDLPKIEVRFEHLNVQAKVHVGSRALPTPINFINNSAESLLSALHLPSSNKRTLTILRDTSGIIKPSRLTLLLGPPGSGKTTLLLALAGKLNKDLQVTGNVTYNGHQMDEFVPQRTAAYISQSDLHSGQMTVRETLDFSACCQGVGSKYEMLSELLRREKALGIKPDADIDVFMKATSLQGQQTNLVTDYVMKILDLENCSDVIVGDEMHRGISGGQKKRVTTGEMLVGPAKALFMDEISTGLDSSTAFQVVQCLRQFVHVMDATLLISLLQPAPETFGLFDDVILLSEGRIVYHGPRELVLEFFESQGFKCPERKGVADFLQEVTSRKDQAQYWTGTRAYSYVSVDDFQRAFEGFSAGQKLAEELEKPFDKASSHPAALVTQRYALSSWGLFRACLAKEVLLIRRNAFVYVFAVFQILITAAIAMTVFIRTEMKHQTVDDGVVFLGAMFFALLTGMFNGFADLAMTIFRLPVFYKQRDSLFYPAWAYAWPMIITRLPISLIEAAAWVILTYWVIGFAPQWSRFFGQVLIFFVVNQMAQGLFRLIAALGRTMVIANTFGAFAILVIICLGGFVISREDIHPWWIWGYWTSPLMYGQNAIAVNEFLAPRWQKVPTLSARKLWQTDRLISLFQPSNFSSTVGEAILLTRGLFPKWYWYWIGVGAVTGFATLFNVGFILAMTYLNPIGKSQAIVPKDMLNERSSDAPRIYLQKVDSSKPDSLRDIEEGIELQSRESGRLKTYLKGMVLPFQPLSLAFHHISYFVDMPPEMKHQGNKLQLLQDISGVFRPAILTALLGVSGAGKTTLMDVLAGRKTGGYIEGEIIVAGRPKKQETFARVSGYCEQNDIHSPNLTVEESLIFSAWMRLSEKVDRSTRAVSCSSCALKYSTTYTVQMFVEEVLELVELASLRGALVGVPGVTGLSVEQRKRLTVAVELVANPSIIFMDEPTSGLDARAAAIVMRTVRNTVNTGRTVVCTIHQPSIDIFEAFDELFLMKRGGQLIYAGPLGKFSAEAIHYFEGVPGVPKIKDGHNPATWILEVTSQMSEARLEIDFAEVYRKASLCEQNEALIRETIQSSKDTPELHFPTKYPQAFISQCAICLWKQHLSYWRNPQYCVIRMFFTAVSAVLFGGIFWDLGTRRSKQQDLFNLIGVLYSAVLFLGVNNASTVQPVVATERTAYYRERAAGMYSALPYAFAQVLVEVPYALVQTLLYGSITYSMIGFEWSIVKVSYFFFFTFSGLLYYTLYGMMAVALTPNEQIAAVVSAFFFGVWNLFAGFIIPYKRIPVWWRWYYWANPVAWTVYGLFTSQLGDVDTLLAIPDQPPKTVRQFMKDHFNFELSFVSRAAAMQVVFIATFALVFAVCIKHLNFQRR
ncbi:pleiotropic drug resistance protein 1 isoform X2 [Selaginella moellendorffii]|uniref:pleiotropic drug resistance protein 1 isoform X2 n=1 Tax=Selaginella moellendorffii TaxID=88036 RepID=UPI000D1CEC73|nr:pleiotropic drug resistance protein 1 isoform X2 [Selaginella moellendorffii]|eukprot:XP_024532454.1 pleiotropic drug resistance protein 1 isoform X2 [Selaginella moellendorffii]